MFVSQKNNMADIKNYQYQNNFSQDNFAMYDIQAREQKAKKIFSILNEYFCGDTDTKSILDIGCSTGIILKSLSEKFKYAVGTDIDKNSVAYAQKKYSSPRLHFEVGDAMNLGFPNESFDVIICTHVYEHVPDSSKLLSEIYRLLRKGGICYFAATNRLKIIEEHYKIPMLSIFPKFIANLYLSILGRGNYYYENHLTLWGLQALISRFELIDYTKKIIENPKKYYATELIKPDTVKQFAALWILRTAYWLSPSYVWLLKKEE